MNSSDMVFMWQLVSATDGRRCAAFACTISSCKGIVTSLTEAEIDSTYVLMLAPSPAVVMPDALADMLRCFPLLKCSSFVEYDFSFIDRYIDSEVSHG